MRTGNSARGFAYMALLVVISASLLTLSAAMPDKFQQAKRADEAQLLFAGRQYQQAIERFYNNRFVPIKRYPSSLAELIEDNRTAKPQHHLRRLYRDPMTDDGQWGLVLNEQEQVMGVYSLSEQTLVKTAFDSERIRVSNPTGATRYSDLKFVYISSLD
jgi:type II secretory pathway pseudopilin PulG